MYHIIYKTTNLINGKIYIGYHGTLDINDGYLGSGKHLKLSIAKYGKDNFKKEILYVYPSKEEALLKEAELVNNDFVNRSDTYNFKLGGEGGWDHILKLLKDNPEFKKKLSNNIRNGMLIAYKNGKKGWPGNHKRKGQPGFIPSDVTKKKMSISQSMTEEEINNRKEIILNSKINFQKFGWVQQISNILNVAPNSFNGWMKKYMPEFYETCFKRKK